MDNTRKEKVAANILTTVASLLNGKIKDPRLGFVTVTSVEVSGDLQHAKVFYTSYGTDSQQQASAAALASAKGLIRSAVGRNLGTRLTPSLEFLPDPVPQQAAAVESALQAARQADAELAARKGSEFAGESDPYKKPRSLAENEQSAGNEQSPGSDFDADSSDFD